MEKISKSKKDNNKNKINIEKLANQFRIQDCDLDVFISYLNEIYLDLYSLVIENKNDLKEENPKELNGLTRIVFSKYYNMPGLIGSRLFSAFDSNRDGLIELFEFITNMKILFYENYEKNSRFIFDFYDFDYDGKITKEDIRVVLSYITLSHTENENISYDNRIENQKELFAMINSCFGKNEKIDFTEFKNIVENKNSDIYLSVFLFLLENKPFSLKNLEPFRKKNPEIKNQHKKPIHSIKYLACPTINSNFQLYRKSLKNISKIGESSRKRSGDILYKMNKERPKFGVIPIPHKRKMTEQEVTNSNGVSKSPIGVTNKKKTNRKYTCSYFQPSNNTNINAKEKKIYEQHRINEEHNGNSSKKRGFFSKILSPIKTINNKILNMKKRKSLCIANNLIIEDKEKNENDVARFMINEQEYSDDSDDLSNSESIDEMFDDLYKNINNADIFYEGKLYKLHNNQLKEVWFKLINKDLFYYKNKNDEIYSGMHNMSGFSFEEEPIAEIEGKKYFNFRLELLSKKRIYYCNDETDYQNWVNKLKNVLNYSDVYEKYEIKEKIREGKYGLIRIATNKITGENFAVKIMSKAVMSSLDLEFVRNEIEILKICQHPYIVKYIEYFENASQIFIIMEYCKGGDLFSYYQKHKNISEQRIAQIIQQLCLAVNYIHLYGIAHRDIKLNNILLIDDGENSAIRLCDFGLSKIVGPSEKCEEACGSLVYTAPEILNNLPYDKQVDLWSIGIVHYILCCGRYPFYDKDTNILMEKIVESELIFKSPNFDNYSKEMKDFIIKLLTKEPKKRMNIIEALKHPWFKKMNMENRNMVILI